ncbi:MAG TPA: sulfatase-like hydrolase/transferase [Vicinamibacterales bacterium]|nr:sulfatase-like hydrolase/transferase [Vicinamibacterales bacterium]
MNRRLPETAARALVLTFCWVTALYAFIASSAFAYLQFIKPRVFHWIGAFSDWHWAASWVWLVLLGGVLWPRMRAAGTQVAARTVAGLALAGVVVNTMVQVLPALHDGPRSVVVGVAALLPIFGLAFVDHLRGWSHLTSQAAPAGEGACEGHDGRALAACLGTAALLTAGYSVLASVSISGAFEPDLQSAGLALGAASSLLGHLLVFSAVFVVLALLVRSGGRSIARQYVLLLLLASLLFARLFARLVGDSVGLVHASAGVAAVATGASIALAWGGSRLAGHAAAHRRLSGGLDVLLGPPSTGEPARRFVVALVAVLPLALGFALLAGRIDWDFALLKSGVVIVWILTFALVYRAAPLRRLPTRAMAAAGLLPLAVHAGWQPSDAQRHTLERYAVHNPSFLVADTLLGERTESRAFDRYLRANTGLTDVAVRPVPIDLVPSLAPAAPDRRPHIFLFVVDSLRSDYLSPYNPAVRFTPRIGAFARDNAVFLNAFTRYGGTGLSMPSIWAGSALAHKQYVVPFDAMNSLQKLLTVNGYRRVQTHDHITEALWAGTDRDVVLDRGKAEMDFDFCATLEELAGQLGSGAAARGPVFAQTRSLNLHVAAVRHGYVPPGRSYAGFEPPYAYRVERIDGCFGNFIDALRRLGLYDRSLVVLTSDHGELIGEDGRWGHGYHLFPQVVQVPLLLHLPAAQAATLAAADTGAVAMSTDITPTLYAALGYRPATDGMLAGRPLTDADAASVTARRRGSVVLAASYGAVYAVVSRNGRRLYIADAIQERDHAYQRSSLSDLAWTEVPVDQGARALGQLRIRRHIDTIGRTYDLDRPF